MNTIKIAFFGLLLTSVSAFSQYNNGGYNNGYGGANRNVGRNYSSPSKPSPEDIEKAKSEQLDKMVAYLKTELTLDELQTIAIKNELASSVKNIEIISKKETSEDDKSKEIKAVTDRTQITINSYLNAEQKEKYKALMAEGKSGKKDKKNKKKDKTAEE